MANVTSSAAVFGSTGLVGSYILSNLLALETLKLITSIARRAPKTTSPNLNAIIDSDTTKWASSLSSLSPTPSVVFSALGTTRILAGGVENQWKIDHDLNIELAQAAKAAGVKTFVFLSSAGTRGYLSSFAPFSKMKIGVENAIKELGFENAVVLRPALILGERERERSREAWVQYFVRGLNTVGLQDTFGAEAEVIARATIRAAQLAAEGQAPSKYWVVEQSDVLRLGRTEWPQQSSEEGQTTQ